MIILDFDGVLFDDERFKRDYWRLFRRHGVAHRIHQAAYAESKAMHRGGYRHDLHLSFIRKRVPAFKIADAQRDIHKLLAGSAAYLYRDAKPFLRHWKSKGETLALVSSGNAFQKRKVRASGLSPFFRATVVADTTDKVDPVRTLVRGSRAARAVFIDDRKNFVDAVKRNFPRILVVQMIRRKDQERSTRADVIVRNLAQARRVIEQWTARPPGARGY